MRIRWRRPARQADDLPAPPLRRRALIALLAVAAGVTVMWLLLERPGDAKRGMKRVTPDAPPCKPGQTAGCVGGKAEVIVVPSASQPR